MLTTKKERDRRAEIGNLQNEVASLKAQLELKNIEIEKLTKENDRFKEQAAEDYEELRHRSSW